MPAPIKDPAKRVRAANVTFAPDVYAMLDQIMREDNESNRSAALSKLVIEEHARRSRRRARAK